MKFRALMFGAAVLLAVTLACSLPLVAPTITRPPSAPEYPPTLTPASAPLPQATITLGPYAGLPSAADLAALYQQTNQAVVAILVYGDMAAPHEVDVPIGQGSGFLIDEQGHIVTNQHVVQEAREIEVHFPSGLKTWATLVGTDPDSDLAVLQVEQMPEGVRPLPLGDSDQVRVGEFVVAIGNPFGLTGTMTGGIVSAKGRTLASERVAPTGGAFTAGDLIQTDAAINPGNSGGPLLNLQGEVIGVNRAIRTESFTVMGDAANSGVGFAVPVNIVRRVAPVLIEQGKYDYPYLGISSLADDRMNLKILEALELPTDAIGAYVTCVTPGGPAAKAGVRGAGRCDESGLKPGGDLIVAIDEKPVRTFSDLLSYLINHTQPGQSIVLTVLRSGKEVQIPVTLEARP